MLDAVSTEEPTRQEDRKPNREEEMETFFFGVRRYFYLPEVSITDGVAQAIWNHYKEYDGEKEAGN